MYISETITCLFICDEAIKTDIQSPRVGFIITTIWGQQATKTQKPKLAT